MDDSQKADLLSFVRDDGKGFIGIHSAAITFTSWPEYGAMLGGYFDGHPWGEFEAALVVEDPGFPGLGHLPRQFTLKDEIYQIKDFSRDRVRVLLRLDPGKVDLSRKGVHRKDEDFAVIWARHYGKGRVLYNGLGHTRDVWDRPEIQEMWLEDGAMVDGHRQRRRDSEARTREYQSSVVSIAVKTRRVAKSECREFREHQCLGEDNAALVPKADADEQEPGHPSSLYSRRRVG